MRYRLFALGSSVLLGLCLVGAVAWIAPARANAPFTVDSTVDEIDAAPGDGNCISTPSGQCTLRAAIMEANALAGDDVLNLPAGIYTLTLAGANEDAGQTGDLDITSTVTIEGAGAENTIVDANTLDRVIQITNTIAVTLSNVTLQGGETLTNPYPSFAGAGIFMWDGQLSLSNTIISDNSAQYGGVGGGIFSYTGTVILDHSTLINNFASQQGGGLANWGGTALLTNSLVMSNTAGAIGGGLMPYGLTRIVNSTIGGNSAYGGGGIHTYYQAQVFIINSVISDNTAYASGGGILNYGWLTVTDSLLFGNQAADTISPISGSGGALYNIENVWIENSTLVSNTSTGDAGGIRSLFGMLFITNSTLLNNQAVMCGGVLFTDQATVVNSTISGNRSLEYGGGLCHVNPGTPESSFSNVTLVNNVADSDNNGTGDGGGIWGDSPTKFSNTLIANNFDLSGQAPDCAGVMTSQDYNLIKSTSGCTVSGTTAHNIYGQDPVLGLLQDNGGPTLTHALLPGSPAIDAGNPVGCTDGLGMLLTTDQRGFPRPVDGGSGIAHCDIGAYELAASWLYLPVLQR